MRHIYFCCLFVFLFFAQAFQAFGNKLPALHPENSNSTDLYLNNNAYTYHWHKTETNNNNAEMEMMLSSTTTNITGASEVCVGSSNTITFSSSGVLTGSGHRTEYHLPGGSWTTITSNTNVNYTFQPISAGAAEFRIRVVGWNSNICCERVHLINVKPTPTNTSISGGNTTICNGTSLNLTASSSITQYNKTYFDSRTFTWSNSGWDCDNITAGGNTSGMPTNAIITSITYQVSIGSECTHWYYANMWSGGAHQGWACNGTYTISNLNGLTANSRHLYIQAIDNDAYCDWITLSLTATVNYSYTALYTPPLSYTWSHSLGSGAAKTVTPNSTTTYAVTATADGCTSSANTTITVQNPPAITAHPSTSAVERCRNSTPFNALSVTATGTATLTYQWYWNSTASNTGGTHISGATSSTYTPPNSTDGTRYYYCIVSNTCGGATRTATSNVSGAHTVHTPPNLGTVSNAGPINFCASNGNYGTAVSVSGSAGSIIWDWGSNNGTWNNNWVAGTSSGVCCFPKKTSNSDVNADRIRYRAVSGTCAPETSSTILITNRWNENPTSLTSTTNAYCGNTAPANITLTASFPAHINMNGTVKFYSDGCGETLGTLIGTVNPSATSSTAVLTITAPTATTTFYARYEPGTGTDCNNSPCVSTSVTVHPFPAPVTVIGGGTYCGSAVLTATGGTDGTVYYQGTTNNGTSTADATTTKTISTLGTNTYYFRSGTAQGCWGVQGSQTLTINPVPTAPTASAATDIQSNAFRANWSAVVGASHYLLDVSTQSNFSTFVPGYEATNVGNVLFFNVTNVTALTTYYYRVRAVHTTGGCVGANSATITVNTGACTAPVMQTITYPPGN